jgi:uncharacterized protein YjbJ (UPF0337 family)
MNPALYRQHPCSSTGWHVPALHFVGVPDNYANRFVRSEKLMAEHKTAGNVGEEVSAFGERAKGAAKDALGAVTGNESLERDGERQNAEGRARQAANDMVGRSDDRSYYVSGLYPDKETANRAYQGLTTEHGYRSEDVDVLMSDDTRQRDFADVKPGEEFSDGNKMAKGFGAGSAIGGGIGATLAAIFAVGTAVVIPGLGLVVAGPIAAALAGAGAGGAAGGLIGALVGAGIPEERANAYERGLKQGGIVLGTRAKDKQHAAELEREFGRYGGNSILR